MYGVRSVAKRCFKIIMKSSILFSQFLGDLCGIVSIGEKVNTQNLLFIGAHLADGCVPFCKKQYVIIRTYYNFLGSLRAG